ncbi:MAG: nuclear transport factor 2 family protein [Verrucomicrobiota bacterium]|jgi:ketosteroid isomerase-like protein
MPTRSQLSATFILGAGLLATALVFGQQRPSEADTAPQAIQKAVLETNAKMTQAANSLNVEAFFDYILETDKGLIIENGTLFKTRQEAMQAVKRGLMGVAKVDRRFDDPQVTVISPEAALLTSEGTVTATLTDGRTMTSRFAVSLVFVRKEGQWKLLHGHYSRPVKM